ncbi:MAG: hypothetical protein UR39_C0010G0015 [Candidatus Woesebacteria bacterium GW2011_GWA1_33_30]|uniref:Polymerase beta nucleotidyltransferase domain-containing protein n=1 Tax=Candidatus Woesebacteria bacterium GW2011_GWA2_33_28 TaxID=1618561 RepID=A0A0F9ZQQ2_9BACT|nr:MAG: hypothetical protein UR38_C0010G0015 [Candidatus Woesebacteria bacterium GW2011_GWA2_33_28]KKP47273.1 MAG: hypothetical protein UR39_C0010G0015 [Candidatus Woesebacteria bacterium GW2011_GWA1_33_30]KKP48919.1 MAG: hypothetical protein UR40_C0011G0015 [Microgenomates group bacterium GW2011_GWC1_33_32]KKP51457.1 MAG: hypothetical protein UR44_C0010G0015 [Candidatus Woesebacteria bacterium GW2011_GWB1_33_38]KKP56929.1 MAG: hypothetical protein UR48_C0026G0012 [Microgenomates group bacteriu
MTIDPVLKNEVKKIVFKYIDPKGVKVFIFGSRASGKNRKFSDIDLGIQSQDEIPVTTKMDLEEGFDQSDIPYKVDIVDFSKVADNFRKAAMQNVIYLN